MNNLVLLTVVGLFLPLGGCIITHADHVLTGNTRPAIDVSQVRIYSSAPNDYQEIGMISAVGSHAFVSSQARTDAAIGRLKKEAASLGANGIIMTSIGDRANGSIGTGVGTSYGSATAYNNGMGGVNAYGSGFGTMTTSRTTIYDKTVAGMAIYVPEK